MYIPFICGIESSTRDFKVGKPILPSMLDYRNEKGWEESRGVVRKR